MELLTKSFQSLKVKPEIVSSFVGYSLSKNKGFSLVKKSLNCYQKQIHCLSSISNPRNVLHCKVLTPFFNNTQHNTFVYQQKSGFHELKKGFQSDFGQSNAYRTCGFSVASKLPKSNQQLLQRSILGDVFTIPNRNVIMINDDGVKEPAQEILDRFRRLGNGLWLYKQPGYDKTDERWKKFLTRSRAWKVYRLQRTFICNEFQSKILDKMVTDYWKAQKWYVDDPYKGYTEETHFYYHPKDLPWNTLDLPKNYYKVAEHRNERNNALKKVRRKQHKRAIDSLHKKIPSTKHGYCFS